MDRAAFAAAFERAAARTLEFGRQFVLGELPAALRFDFAAAGRGPEPDGRVKFHGGRLLAPAQLRGVEPDRACRYLWVDGRVPDWVNLAVHAADAEFTFIEITVSGRLIKYERLSSFGRGPDEPFQVRGPALPPGWVSLEVSGRFNLGWRAGSPDET